MTQHQVARRLLLVGVGLLVVVGGSFLMYRALRFRDDGKEQVAETTTSLQKQEQSGTRSESFVGIQDLVESVAATIGPAGGALELADGFRVEVPAGALDEPVMISVRRLDEGSIGATYELLPHGLVFAKPVRVVIPYDTAQFEELGVAPDSVTIYQDNLQRTSVKVGGTSARETWVSHFSLFRIDMISKS